MTSSEIDKRDLRAPEVYLLWESQRFPLRSLSCKQFVVRCESMVRRHDPNQRSSVLHGTLTSDLGDDISVLFRVSGTDQQMARCELSALASDQLQRVERLNSAWQAALATAAARRAEEAELNRHSKIESERQQASAPPAPSAPPNDPKPAASPSIPSSTAITGSTPAAKPPSRQRSNPARYVLAAVISATVLGLLFARPHFSTETERLTEAYHQPVDRTANQLATGSNPESTYLPKSDAAIKSRVAPSQVTTPVRENTSDPKSDVATQSIDRVARERVQRSLGAAERELAKLTRQYKSALEDQLQLIQEAREAQSKQLQTAQQEFAAATEKVDKTEALLKKLAPLIADENIGAAEVQSIKAELATAKQQRETKALRLRKLKQVSVLGIDPPKQNEINQLTKSLTQARANRNRLQSQLAQ